MLLQVAEIGNSDEERRRVVNMLDGIFAPTNDILAAIRKNPQVCVLLVRVQKDEEKKSAGYE